MWSLCDGCPRGSLIGTTDQMDSNWLPRCDVWWDPETGYPPRFNGMGNCFRGHSSEGNGFRQTGEPIHTCEQVIVALTGR